MTAILDQKRLFDAIRTVKGGPLSTEDVLEINRALGLVADKPPPTVAEFIGGFIRAHEGGLSMRADDNGNYQGGRRGVGKLIGSKFGVTGPALAAYRGVDPYSITADDIANLTIEEAIKVGVRGYYERPRFDLLPWNRVTASVVDKGWGSGPAQAIKLLQRMVGVADDGKMGPATASAYRDWLGRHGEEAAAHQWADVRIKFDTSLGQPQFLKGWNSRSRSFLPGTAWWREWGV
ncbi:glycosyl hydrolase 108 family protein [Sphingomonas sp. 1P06PA]|uniref:glycosyl hydrolase 108 family protein n=1 Tax=Sphingomonas sp. 1P06PA TaxID=554121 RepID=UPI0039A72C10